MDSKELRQRTIEAMNDPFVRKLSAKAEKHGYEVDSCWNWNYGEGDEDYEFSLKRIKNGVPDLEFVFENGSPILESSNFAGMHLNGMGELYNYIDELEKLYAFIDYIENTNWEDCPKIN